jgi:hypothetical protein
VSVKPAADPILAAAVSAVVDPRTIADPAPKRSTAGVSGRTLRAAAALPTDPGAYVVGLSLTDRRFGDRFVATEPVAVFVPGLRRAALRVRAQERLPESGERIPVTVAIANPSGMTWADTARPNADEREDRIRNTRLVGTWVRLDPSADGVADAEVRRTVDIGHIALEPGRHTRVSTTLAVPAEPGRWALVVDVVDDIDGSFAAGGSAPGVAIFRVLPAPVIEGVE